MNTTVLIIPILLHQCGLMVGRYDDRNQGPMREFIDK